MKYRLEYHWILIAMLLVTASGVLNNVLSQENGKWKLHDMNRPQPAVVTPGTASTHDTPGKPPSDAIVLFDGKDLSAWQKNNGEPATWKVENGYMEVVKNGGSIKTRQGFGDCQLHIEWSTPVMKDARGQHNGNSGIHMMEIYELQILNSYQNQTYPDGQAGALYGQLPPIVNSSRPSLEWQSYDIIFHRPRFAEDGQVQSPALVTVLHNGVLVQDHEAFTGPVDWQAQPAYRVHPDRVPIGLQDHGNPIRFRNIWIRDLEQYQRPAPAPSEIVEITLDAEKRQKYFGQYKSESGGMINIKDHDDKFAIFFGENFKYHIFPLSPTEFTSRKVAADFTFQLNAEGNVSGLIFDMGGDRWVSKKL